MLTELWDLLWPGWGAVWPNILASIICGSVVWLWARRHLHRLHRRHDELRDAVAALHEHTATIAGDTNRLVRVLSDRLGIDPDTGEDRLPKSR